MLRLLGYSASLSSLPLDPYGRRFMNSSSSFSTWLPKDIWRFNVDFVDF